MSKRFLCLLLCLCLFALPACAEKESITVTASFYPMYITLLALTRDVPGLSLSCLAPADTGCVHDYQLTTADRRLLERTDLLVINGGGMEAFLEPLLPQLKGRVANASEGLALLPAGGGGALHGEGTENPHLWVSLPGNMAQVRNLCEALAALDPENEERYRANGAAYLEKLDALYARM